jgi:hypothetical protein
VRLLGPAHAPRYCHELGKQLLPLLRAGLGEHSGHPAFREAMAAAAMEGGGAGPLPAASAPPTQAAAAAVSPFLVWVGWLCLRRCVHGAPIQ